MAGAGFQSVAKFHAQIFNPVLADRGLYSTDCHSENHRTADWQHKESNLSADCQRPEPSVWFLLGLSA
jgi:hypothetical protein